jgi:fluoroquinolone resistance protein
MAERKYGEAAPKTTDSIASLDWYEQVLSNQKYERTLFVDLDMSEAHSTGAVFNECTFRRARFNGSTHQSSAFINCTFAFCNFFDSKFTDCKFVGSMFSDCQFHHMRVEDSDWAFVGLPGADLEKASFLRTRLREADLTGARCHGSSVRESDLSGAWLHSADFTECDLRGSDLSALDPKETQIKEAIINLDQTLMIAENLGFDIRID